MCKNTQWATTGTQYACPQCARRYVPWVVSGNRTDAQKVMVLGRPECAGGVPGHAPSAVGAQGSGSAAVGGSPAASAAGASGPLSGQLPPELLGLLGPAEWTFVLCEWPDTATTNLHAELKTINAGLEQTFREAPLETIQKEILEVVARAQRPYFEYRPWTDAHQARFDEQHAGSKKQWSVEPCKDGYDAFTFPYPPTKEEDYILSHKDVIRMWGLCRGLVAVGQQLAARL